MLEKTVRRIFWKTSIGPHGMIWHFINNINTTFGGEPASEVLFLSLGVAEIRWWKKSQEKSLFTLYSDIMSERQYRPSTSETML